jgi:hypothetical protein
MLTQDLSNLRMLSGKDEKNPKNKKPRRFQEAAVICLKRKIMNSSPLRRIVTYLWLKGVWRIYSIKI